MIKRKCLKNTMRSQSSIVLKHLPKKEEKFKSNLLTHSSSKSINLCRTADKTTLNVQKDMVCHYINNNIMHEFKEISHQSINSSILSLDDSDNEAQEIYNRDLQKHTLNKQELRYVFPLKPPQLSIQKDQFFNFDNKLMVDLRRLNQLNSLFNEASPLYRNENDPKFKNNAPYSSINKAPISEQNIKSIKYLKYLSVLTTKKQFYGSDSFKYTINKKHSFKDFKRLKGINMKVKEKNLSLSESSFSVKTDNKDQSEFHSFESIQLKHKENSTIRMIDNSNCFLKFSSQSKANSKTDDSFIMESIQHDVIRNLENENLKIKSKIEEVTNENAKLMELLTDCDKLKMIVENFEIFNKGNINLDDSF